MPTSVVPVRTMAQSAVLLAARTAGRVARPFLLPLRGLLAWPVSSQAAARHNALVAEQELARRRTEREDVAAFLATLPARLPSPPVAVPSPSRGNGLETAEPVVDERVSA